MAHRQRASVLCYHAGMIVWDETTWQPLRAAHRLRLESFVSAHRKRRAAGLKHPVYDFLFDYYNHPPGRLLEWSPGLDVALTGPSAQSFLDDPHYTQTNGGMALDPSKIPAHRLRAAQWTIVLLENTLIGPARFTCFGLHEWAMVLETETPRHTQLPMRLSPAELSAFVRSQEIVCSHFDAFRFFTPAARPLNTLQPTRDSQHELDQAGCLHVIMDLYKWAYKFSPWIPSQLVADAFLLAVEARELDMQASPHDVTALGLEPVRIETAAGRIEYQRRQRLLHEKSQPLRSRLLEAYRLLLRNSAQSSLKAS